MTVLSSKPRASDVDHYVGTRLRARRVMLGLSQTQLADLIGVTYQQAHKYERGINRLSAGRLHRAAQALGVSTDYFFEGLESERPFEPSSRQRMCLELARNFTDIKDPLHQDALSLLARALAAETPEKIAVAP